MVEVLGSDGKLEGFAQPPWMRESEEWQALDESLPDDHLAREIQAACTMLNLSALLDSYLGVGKKALRPDLLVPFVLYELQSGRPSPAQWSRDAKENAPARWLLFGMAPSRALLYRFRERIAPFLREFNEQVARIALAIGMTQARRAALDGTSIAADASRRQLLNAERLQKRQAAIDQRLQLTQAGHADAKPPAWMARTEEGLRLQKRRYRQAAEILRERQAANRQRLSSKRKPDEKVLVSPVDPESVLARDKENVFRPLYTVQLLRDLDSPLIVAYDVLRQNNDEGVVEPMLARVADRLGCKIAELLVDSGYTSLRHLQACQRLGTTLYGPFQENDYSKRNKKKTQSNQHTTIPKAAFLWMAAEQTYQCPEGHRLRFDGTTTQRRAEHQITLHRYVCPAEHCRVCVRQTECTPNPDKGRSVSRMEHEELVDALRTRMATDEAKTFYRLRSQTVELNHADLKQHRGLRRFHSRRPIRVTAEVGLHVLAHNSRCVHAYAKLAVPENTKDLPTSQLACAA